MREAARALLARLTPTQRERLPNGALPSSIKSTSAPAIKRPLEGQGQTAMPPPPKRVRLLAP